ncbi:TorD/DmsD family molecular chaperone [Azonexus fungiphilus]|jgi:TorA maturation chaperone TorD|uniref:TorD/DmsD family molecular chaperone n=1 Tax=Azonexus fungiphilus TaxID=146940 RepID=UPI00156BD33C|nr:molecular chaperone TorD family protein [Azonexus fungiphilus]NHC06641.1 molecular chaperone TorD family protein [Azonexus fungiphilus]
MSALFERIAAAPPLADEDRARAEHYALISALFAAPDVAFVHRLPALASSWGTIASPLGQAWLLLADAARAIDAEALEDEYTRLFLTIGKPEVMLYGSFHIAGFLMEEPLVELRHDLAELGLGRRAGVSESEDHIAALADVMRHLIVTGPDAAGLQRQKAFFEKHLAPWHEALADALERAPDSRFYARTAPLLRAFFAVERLAFDMI